MKVRCITHGGISILNAISSGFGSSMAVELTMSVTVKRGESMPKDRLTRSILDILHERYGIDGKYHISADSKIPPSRGLKSSSAYSTALVKAIDVLEGIGMKDEEILRVSCLASLGAGVSITGAFDDASASFFGGMTLADNERMKLLRRWEVDEGLNVLIAHSGMLKKEHVAIHKYKLLSEIGKLLTMMVEEGKHFEAMTINGMLTAVAHGYNQALAYDAISHGALAAGITGTGPAIAIIAEGWVIEEIEKLAKLKGYNTLRTRPTNAKYKVEIV